MSAELDMARFRRMVRAAGVVENELMIWLAYDRTEEKLRQMLTSAGSHRHDTEKIVAFAKEMKAKYAQLLEYEGYANELSCQWWKQVATRDKDAVRKAEEDYLYSIPEYRMEALADFPRYSVMFRIYNTLNQISDAPTHPDILLTPAELDQALQLGFVDQWYEDESEDIAWPPMMSSKGVDALFN